MRLIDSHCHFDFKEFDADRDVILQHCLSLGIDRIIIPGVDAASWQRLLDLCEYSPHYLPALGLHPMFIKQHRSEQLSTLITLAKKHPIIAIGEVGLDFYHSDHDKQGQLSLFQQQLDIAADLKLPVILHVRKAHDQVLKCLKQAGITAGIVHAFNGSQQQAEHYIEQGLLLGVGGVITHIKAKRLRRLFSTLPLEAIALETDAPDMPLANQKESRNSPSSIAKILASLSSLRQESIEKIAAHTSKNVEMTLQLPSYSGY